ncbi:MAG: tRNA (adenosine(37)-N6)-threonylcarbamoyltransferase complex ATPase subunit type 1 TsaE, partial [Betaproteobacteria bacterium]
MRQRKDFLDDESATERLGEAIGHMLRPGLKIYLHGDLGAGKTFLTRAILRAAGHTGRVKSPTYT